MAGTTEHYGLTIWGREDEFKDPEGLNGNFEAVDEVMATKCDMVCGTYTGSGAQSRSITLGFRPKAVFVINREGNKGISANYIGGGFAIGGHDLYYNSYSSYPAIGITDTGFRVSYISDSSHCTNQSGKTYFYVALR